MCPHPVTHTDSYTAECLSCLGGGYAQHQNRQRQVVTTSRIHRAADSSLYCGEAATTVQHLEPHHFPPSSSTWQNTISSGNSEKVLDIICFITFQIYEPHIFCTHYLLLLNMKYHTNIDFLKISWECILLLKYIYVKREREVCVQWSPFTEYRAAQLFPCSCFVIV